MGLQTQQMYNKKKMMMMMSLMLLLDMVNDLYDVMIMMML